MSDLFPPSTDTSYLVQETTPAPRRNVRAEQKDIQRASTIATGATLDPSIGELVKQELTQNQTSPTFSAIKEEALEEKNQFIGEQVRAVLQADIPASQKKDLVETAAIEAADITPIEILENVLSRTAKTTPGSVEQQEDIRKFLTVREQNIAFFRKYGAEKLGINTEQTPLDPIIAMTFPGLVPEDPEIPRTDTLMSLTLPGWGAQVKDVLDAAAPGFPTEGTVVSPGTLIEDFGNYLETLSAEEAQEVLRRVVHSIDDNQFFGVDNGYVKLDMFHTILEGLKPEDVPRFFYNIVGAMDLIGAAELARLGYLGVKNIARIGMGARAARNSIINTNEQKAPGSASQVLDETAPEDSKEIHEAILEDQDDVAAEALGTDRIQLTVTHLGPKPFEVPINNAPDLSENLSVRLRGNIDRTQNFSEAELEFAQTRLGQKIKELEDAVPDVHFNKSEVRNTGIGYELKGVIGKNPARGFNSFTDVLEFSKTLDKDVVPVEDFLVLDTRDQYIRSMDAVPVEHRGKNWYVQVRQSDDFLSTDVEHMNPMLENGVLGTWAKWFSKSASFITPWRFGGATGADQMATVQRALNDILTPLSTMSPKNQSKVLDLLDEGDRMGKWFHRAELEARFGLDKAYPKLVKAYESYLLFHREARQLINDAAYNKTISLGLKLARFGDESKLASVVNQVPADIKRVYDPKIDLIRDLTPLEREALEDEPGSFLRFNTPISKKIKGRESEKIFGEAEYALKVGDLEEIPKQILKDNPGYLTRTYDGKYVVYREIPAEDGQGLPKIREEVEFFAKTKAEADEMAKRLNESSDDSFKAREVDELSASAGIESRTDLDYLESFGELFYSQRSKEILDVHGNRIVSSVGDRIQAFRDKASRSGTFDFTIDKLIKNWEKVFGETYGKNGQIDLFGKLPEIKTKNDVTKRERQDAQASLDHIKMLMGVDENRLKRANNQAMINIAGFINTNKLSFAGRTRNRLAGVALDASKGQFLELPKQAAFLRWIVGAPLRQVALQSQQASVYLSNPGALKYISTGRGVMDHTMLLAGLSLRDSEKWGALAPALAKGFGSSVDELTKLVDAVRVSGLVDNIDSHAFTEVMSVSGEILTGGKISHSVFSTLKSGAKFMRKYGFDAGEKYQLMYGFLIKKNEWQLNNPKIADKWAEKGNLSQIAASTREISFHMNQAGVMQFQRGAVSNVFQFMSHNMKAWQALIPSRTPVLGRFSDKSFAGAQRMSLWAQQTALYGFGGFGLHEAYEVASAKFGWDLDNDTDLAIKEGISGTLLNMMLRTADDPDAGIRTTLDVSAKLAPFSGVTRGTVFSQLLTTQFLTDLDLTQNMPGLQTMQDLASALKTIGYMTGVGTMDMLDIDPNTQLPKDKSMILRSMDTALRMVPLYNNFMKSRAEQALGRFVNNSGDPGIQATAQEILASELFGLTSTRKRRIEESRRQITGSGLEMDELGITAALREHAEGIYDRAKKIALTKGAFSVTPEDLVPTEKELTKAVEDLALAEMLRVVEDTALLDGIMLSEWEFNKLYKDILPEIIANKAPRDFEDAKDFNRPELEFIDLLDNLITSDQLPSIERTRNQIKDLPEFKEQKEVLEFLDDLIEE